MSKCVIRVPRTVENNYDGFCFLSSLFSKSKGFSTNDIELDFKKTRWFEANLVSVLGAWVESKLIDNCKIILSNLTSSIENVFRKNGFYEAYNLGAIRDYYDSTIKYKAFPVYEHENFSHYVSKSVIPKIRLNLSNELMKSFKLSLNEIFSNVQFHAKSDKVYTCGQYYHTKRKVAFTMTDLGSTIGFNVREKLLDEFMSDSAAIQWATKFGNTTKTQTEFHTEMGGIGLHIIEEFLVKNNGIFQIISGNGFWENHRGTIAQYNLDYYFPGTIVNLISKLENTFTLESDILF